MSDNYHWNLTVIDVVAITHTLDHMARLKDSGDLANYNYVSNRLPNRVHEIGDRHGLTIRALDFVEHETAHSINYSLPCDMINAVCQRDHEALETALGYVLGLWAFRREAA